MNCCFSLQVIFFQISAPFLATRLAGQPLNFVFRHFKKLKKGFMFLPYFPEHLLFPHLLLERDLLLDFLPQSIVGAILKINCNLQFRILNMLVCYHGNKQSRYILFGKYTHETKLIVNMIIKGSLIHTQINDFFSNYE